MGTQWRGLLAVIDRPTGDGRRFAQDSITHRELPLALKWQRVDDEGHDDSVVVGRVERLRVDHNAGEVWGEGELFDDVSPTQMPRLAQDVAEAKFLIEKQTIGPSVDPGAFQATMVLKGTDVEPSAEMLDALWMRGEEPELEVLFTAYEIAAATLVTVPAFAEARPFELLAAALTAAVVRRTGWADLPLAAREREWDSDAAKARVSDHCGVDGDDPNWDCYARAFLYRDEEADAETKGAYSFPIVDIIDGDMHIVPRAVFAAAAVLEGARGGTNIPAEAQDTMRSVISGIYRRMADEFDDPDIVAPWDRDRMALTAAAPTVDPRLFDIPVMDGPTPATMRELDNGLVHVFGHVATHDVCHVGIPGVCRTAPHEDDFGAFHRYLTTDSGLDLPVPVGRLTAGFGQFEGACSCCRGNDDHACDNASFGAAVAQHDQMETTAWIRVAEDEANNAIAFAGILDPAASERAKALLRRQKISGDWRDIGGELHLTEVLVLNRAKPGFPLPRMSAKDGRQRSLTAAGVVRPGTPKARQEVDAAFARQIADMVVAQLRPQPEPEPEVQPGRALTAAEVHSGAMVALRMTEEDAARLAVTDGLSIDDLHLTLAYLGTAADITPQVREQLTETLTETARRLAPVEGDGFAINAFNPGEGEPETALVLGVGGDDLSPLHELVMLALADVEGLVMPGQHAPWVAHVTLQYTPNLGQVQALADRVGPVRFDRLRLAFAGEIVDMPLGDPESGRDGRRRPDEEQMAVWRAQLAATAQAVRVDRARQARAALSVLEGVG